MLTGEIHPMVGAVAAGDEVKIPLVLGPYESKAVIVGPLAKGIAGAAEPSFATGTTLADFNGDWKLDLNGKQLDTPLRSWEDLGASGFAGPATYSLEFTAPLRPKGKHVYLEIGEVHDYAHVTLNGKEVGARSFQPYRWDVTADLKPGANELKIEVYGTAAQGRGPGAPPPAAATAAAAPGLATVGAAGAGAAGAAARRRPGAAGAGAAGAGAGPQVAGAGAAMGAPPAGGGGGGRGGAAAPPESGLLGGVKLVAY
jgi:hypothetical protein